MGTPFNSIEDRGLITVRDYKIDKLYQKYLTSQSENDLDKFYKYLDGFLISAVSNFTRCQQSLEYDTTTREFVADLTDLEQSILADMWVIAWWEKERNDVTQISNVLQVSSAFSTFSPAQNMKEKSSIIAMLQEDVDRKMTQYQLDGAIDYHSNIFEGW